MAGSLASKGLGFALAREFLAGGPARVVVYGRDEARLEAAMASLHMAKHPDARLFGMPCDVSEPTQVAAFARFSEDSLDRNVHFWINNAG